MGWAAFFIVALLLVGSIAVSEASEWELDEMQVPNLRMLDDTSFEHDTQAATGQTTGFWLILFTGSDCEICGDVESVLLQVASRLNEGMPIVAKVNTSESPRTAKRFSVYKAPQLKLFRDRHMFSYGGQWSAAKILTFIKDGWRVASVEDVPKEVTLVHEIQENLWAIYKAIIKYLGNRPGILAGVGSILAMGGYVFTRKWLLRNQRKNQQKKTRSTRPQKRAD